MNSKLKLFALGIAALLLLVGVVTYRQYSALQSIDSYEECAAAKGSTIQESYPATCVTRLGMRFTQLRDLETDPSTWENFDSKSQIFTLKYPSNWFVLMDEDRYVGWSSMIGNNKYDKKSTESIQINIENSNIFEVPWSNGQKVTITPKNFGYFVYYTDSPATSTFLGRPAIKIQESSITTGTYTAISLLDKKRLIQIKIHSKEPDQFVQHERILSTFRFTDSI